jgi:hypothetical protein
VNLFAHLRTLSFNLSISLEEQPEGGADFIDPEELSYTKVSQATYSKNNY